MLAIIGLSFAGIFIKSLFVEYSYENQKAAFVLNNILEWNYDFNYFQAFIVFLFKHYVELIVVMLGTGVYYFSKKRWSKDYCRRSTE